jgi:biopolymer transport protein ExbD
MRFASHKHKRAPSVIIVSLIDVLLVVLIFLMVTTTVKKVEPSLRLTLPSSREAKPGATEDKKPFTILVSSNFPYFFIGDKAITYDKLERELAAAVKANPQLHVAIRSDKQAPFGEVVKLIDATTAAKVGSLQIVTEKQAKP